MLSAEQQQLLGRQAERQQVAGQLLDDLQLPARWQAYGQPVLCGALAYGLLVAPDFDLEINGRPDIDAGFARHQPATGTAASQERGPPWTTALPGRSAAARPAT